VKSDLKITFKLTGLIASGYNKFKWTGRELSTKKK
jgi:hypothetical protein